jgi:hypothetical protein
MTLFDIYRTVTGINVSDNVENFLNLLRGADFNINIKQDPTLKLYLLKHSPKTDTTKKFTKYCDGTMVDYNMNVVCYSGPFAPTFSASDPSLYTYLKTNDELIHINAVSNTKELEAFSDTIRAQEYNEGTLVRLFYHTESNQWRVSTKGHTDANKSKWTSTRSYAELFWETLGKYYTDPAGTSYNADERKDFLLSVLCNDKRFVRENTYSFILQHPENLLTIRTVYSKLFLVGVYDNTTLQLVQKEPAMYSHELFSNPALYEFTNLNKFWEHLQSNSSDLTPYLNTATLATATAPITTTALDRNPVTMAPAATTATTLTEQKSANEIIKGYIINDSQGYPIVYILSRKFEYAKFLRGNTLKMDYHYLGLRNNNCHLEFLTFFPEFKDVVTKVDSQITTLVEHVYNNYKLKFVHKHYVPLTKLDWRFLYPIHGYYLRSKIPVTIADVYFIMHAIQPMFGVQFFIDEKQTLQKVETNSQVLMPSSGMTTTYANAAMRST